MAELVTYQDGSVVSRQITKANAGNVTLFAFDQDQGLSEHTEIGRASCRERVYVLV